MDLFSWNAPPNAQGAPASAFEAPPPSHVAPLPTKSLPGAPSAVLAGLRDYQSEVLERVWSMRDGGKRKVLLVAPTGSGKTVIGSAMVKQAAGQGLRVMFMVHRRELVKQSAAKLWDVGIDAGIIQAGFPMRLEEPVQVASVQTLHARAMRSSAITLPEADLVIVDEAHHILAKTWTDIANEYPGSLIVGLTATPCRGDGRGLGRMFEVMVECPDVAELIKRGYLVGTKVYAPAVPDLKGVKTTAGDYNEKQLAQRVDKAELVGDIVMHWLKLAERRKTVVFAVDVAHSVHIRDEFRRASVVAEHIDGTTPMEERDAILKRLSEGKAEVVVNCMVLCLDSETEILTRAGWRGMGEMRADDEVANWDQGHITYEMPLEIVRRPRADGERMVVLETERRSIRVTEGHWMLYRTKQGGRWLKAQARDLVGKQIELPVSGVADMPRAPLTDDECRLIGFWMGDGTKTNLQSGGVEYTMTQSKVYPHIIAWVDALIARCGLHVIKREREHTVPHVRWSLCRGTGRGSQKRAGVVHLEHYLDKSGAHLGRLNGQQFDAFLEGLWLADGNHGDGLARRRTMTIYGVDLDALSYLQGLAATRGWLASITKATAPRETHHRQLYQLRLRRGEASHRATKYRLRFEDGWIEESVWCVKTRTKNIVTRRRGTVTVMGNTEGWDQPDVGCIVLARPTKHIGLYRQMVGRVLRPWEGKTHALVLDHAGCTFQHGFVDEPVQWTLSETERAVLPNQVARQKHKKPALTTCPECKAVRQGGRPCDACGWHPVNRPGAVDTVEGDLAELGRDGSRGQVSLAEKMRFYGQLLWICNEKGYRHGWAAHKYKEKYGVWPARSAAEPIEPDEKVRAWVRSRQIAWLKSKQRERAPA